MASLQHPDLARDAHTALFRSLAEAAASEPRVEQDRTCPRDTVVLYVHGQAYEITFSLRLDNGPGQASAWAIELDDVPAAYYAAQAECGLSRCAAHEVLCSMIEEVVR